MNKQKFVHILNNRKAISQEDLEKIELLEKDYPYSQVLHTLSAIASYTRKAGDARQKLNTASLYSTNRTILKDLVVSIDEHETAPDDTTSAKTETRKIKPSQSKSEDTELQPSLSKKESHVPSKSIKNVSVTPKDTIIDQLPDRPKNLSEKEAEELRQEVMKNLEDLMIIKHNFLKAIGSESGVKSSKKKLKKISKKNGNKEAKDTRNEKNEYLETKKKPSKSAKGKAGPKKKKKEQNKIIERFIKEDPKIKNSQNRETTKSQNDLSIQSVEFGEELVSENLAKIMIKQGKKSKAVDIYKKLIWKYPQKKAYFASQIESLKEK